MRCWLKQGVLLSKCVKDNQNKKATNKILSYKISEKDFPCNNQIDVVFSNNETIRMIDFSSSGANWYQGKNKLTVWMDKE